LGKLVLGSCHQPAKISRQRTAMLTMDQGRITYRETPLPLALRGFIAVLAVGVGLGIPAAWLTNVTTQTSWPVLALLVVVVGVCLALGGFFLLLVLVSATELQIDPTQPDALRIRRGPVLNDRTPIPRRSFGSPEVVMRSSEDGDYPLLRLPLPGGSRIEMACFDSRTEAEGWCRAISAALRA
jgi:hypothetical protein